MTLGPFGFIGVAKVNPIPATGLKTNGISMFLALPGTSAGSIWTSLDSQRDPFGTIRISSDPQRDSLGTIGFVWIAKVTPISARGLKTYEISRFLALPGIPAGSIWISLNSQTDHFVIIWISFWIPKQIPVGPIDLSHRCPTGENKAFS